MNIDWKEVSRKRITYLKRDYYIIISHIIIKVIKISWSLTLRNNKNKKNL